MTQLDWSIFRKLPGADCMNFERLWRKIIWSHYGQYGSFRALASQPGVEFHLKLNQSCALGEPGRWFGWQCRWYDIRKGSRIYKTRRKHIQEALTKTEEHLPDLTDWVLCTRNPLAKVDQDWFYGLTTEIQLHLWSEAQLEDHLDGAGLMCRRTFFGDLVLTPDLLEEIHSRSVAPIHQRWLPKIHQESDAEKAVRRYLGETTSWTDLSQLIERLELGAHELESIMSEISSGLDDELKMLIRLSRDINGSLVQIKTSLENGDFDILQQELKILDIPKRGWNTLLSRLRGRGHRSVLYATNLVADIYGAHAAYRDLKHALSHRLVAIAAKAGCGKTQLSAQLTAATEDRPGGILLYGKNLQSRQTLNDLARHITIHGEQVNNFETLLAAVDAAGERSGRRLPIVIDGLNEAEDPRDWKAILASLEVGLEKYSYTMIVCTLRPTIAEEALPPNLATLKIKGFERHTDDAIECYFQHYRISPSQFMLPRKLLSHPLTLRIFCDVTNPERKHVVAVESVPSSLTALFERYVTQVANRIQELASRNAPHQRFEIIDAIQKIGLALWVNDIRVMGEAEARKLIGDSNRPWPASIIYALQDNGILIREYDAESDERCISIVFDPLAGHIIAEALLKKYSRSNVESWFQDKVRPKLLGEGDPRHPLADDVFRSLIGLLPRRRLGSHLWKLLKGPLKEQALTKTAWLEGDYLDSETVSELSKLINSLPYRSHRIYDRIWESRAIPSYPLNASFLDSVLRLMSIPDRDLSWTEWIRENKRGIIYDIRQVEERWRNSKLLREQDVLLARWIMWTLTSTVRSLRDCGTRALYHFGCINPQDLFAMTLSSLEVNDPYVSERMMAACYGVAMSLWADPKGSKLCEALPDMAEKIIDQMFAPGAPHSTCHTLKRDYAVGLVTLAAKVNRHCIPKQRQRYAFEFKHTPSPFPEASTITDSDVADAKQAVRMDFRNYTMGRLVPDRYNYDFDNRDYQDIRRQIYWRILDLGYSPSKFGDAERDISIDSRPRRGGGFGKIDRYGKKYSWIAFFEMYGVLLNRGVLPAGLSGERPSDADIDPSFPEPPKTWLPELSDLFDGSPTDPKDWSKYGPDPDYSHLLKCTCVDGHEGPWALLHGYVVQKSKRDERLVWTSIRCYFVESRQIPDFFSRFESVENIGSSLPKTQSGFHAYAGEIPWSHYFDNDLPDSKGGVFPNAQEVFSEFKDGAWQSGMLTEIPVHQYEWEDYPDQSNKVNTVYVLAPSICDNLQLRNRQGEWDLFDSSGNIATLYRVLDTEQNVVDGHLSYLRLDLLRNYLQKRQLVPVWLLWGERSFRLRSLSSLTDEIRDIPSGYRKFGRL